MGDADYIRLRKQLTGPLLEPTWPEGVAPAPFQSVDPSLLHALLEVAFPGGLVAPCDDWYGNLTSDDEFDPALCLPALDAAGCVAGFAQCWTSGFIKDLAVAPHHRNKGVGTALLWTVFARFKSLGVPHVDLKTELTNTTALRLYASVGMVEVPR